MSLVAIAKNHRPCLKRSARDLRGRNHLVKPERLARTDRTCNVPHESTARALADRLELVRPQVRLLDQQRYFRYRQ